MLSTLKRHKTTTSNAQAESENSVYVCIYQELEKKHGEITMIYPFLPNETSMSMPDFIRKVAWEGKVRDRFQLIDTLNIVGGRFTENSWKNVVEHMTNWNVPPLLCMKHSDAHPDSATNLMNRVIADKRVTSSTVVVYAEIPKESMLMVSTRLQNKMFSNQTRNPRLYQHLMDGLDDYILHVFYAAKLCRDEPITYDKGEDKQFLRELYDGLPINYHVYCKNTGLKCTTFKIIVQ